MRRKRVRVCIASVGEKTQSSIDRRRKVFGELVSDIMTEHKVSWDKAKTILKNRMLNNELNML